MNRVQPATLTFEADTATVISLQSALVQRGRRPLKFRGSEKEKVGFRSAEPVAAGPVQTFTVAVQSDADLLAAHQALASAGVKAWMTVNTLQGPQPMELGEYLRQRGLA